VFSVAFETSAVASYVEFRFNAHLDGRLDTAHLQNIGVSNIRLKNCNVVPRQITQSGGSSFVANYGEDFVLGVGTQLLDELKLNKGEMSVQDEKTVDARTSIPLEAPVTT
jgi:hypothetical protein